jgi:hypothetical protein
VIDEISGLGSLDFPAGAEAMSLTHSCEPDLDLDDEPCDDDNACTGDGTCSVGECLPGDFVANLLSGPTPDRDPATGLPGEAGFHPNLEEDFLKRVTRCQAKSEIIRQFCESPALNSEIPFVVTQGVGYIDSMRFGYIDLDDLDTIDALGCPKGTDACEWLLHALVERTQDPTNCPVGTGPDPSTGESPACYNDVHRAAILITDEYRVEQGRGGTRGPVLVPRPALPEHDCPAPILSGTCAFYEFSEGLGAVTHAELQHFDANRQITRIECR